MDRFRQELSGMAKILVVEDDERLSAQLVECLRLEHHLAECTGDGKLALEYLRQFDYDLVVLDIELPGLTGVQVCQTFRSEGGKTPVLMLTGRSTADDKVTGLDAGADDYLTKPFNIGELMARTRALLRRPPVIQDDLLTAGPLEINSALFTARVNGRAVELLPKEFAVLQFLMRNPNRVFSAEALIEKVWPSDADVSMNTVRTCMYTLRKKLGAETDEVLETVRGVGYRIST
jgi:DNA-binding response OmpR family regulator